MRNLACYFDIIINYQFEYMIQSEPNQGSSKKQQTTYIQSFYQQGQSDSLLQDQEWRQLKAAIRNKFQSEGSVFAKDQALIQQQTQIISDLIEQINKKKQKQNFPSMDVLPIQTSFSNISAVYNVQNDDSFFKSKFAEQFQRSLVNSVLKEVEQSCSSQTYQSVKSYIMNNKQKQFQNSQILVKKLNQQKQDLKTTLIIKSNQLVHCQNKLSVANSKLQSLEQQKKKIKFKSDKLMQKQKRIHKAQMSLVFKEKISSQGKKRYQREKSLFLSIEQRLKKLYQQMNKIWQQICKKMEYVQQVGCLQKCEQGKSTQCWKKQVMKKCKNQLLEQRNLLKQQEAQIQKQYDMMHLLSEQMRKMANEQQFSGSSQPSLLSIYEQKI